MSESKSSKPVLGGVFVLLLVASIGLKVMRSVQKNAQNTPPTPSYSPPVRPEPAPVEYEKLPIPPAEAPTVTGSALDLAGWAMTSFEEARFRLYAPPNPAIADAPKDQNGKTTEPGRRWTWRLADGKLTLLAEYRDQKKTEALQKLFTTDSLLDSLVAGFTRNGSDVVGRAVKLRGSPGREADWVNEKGVNMRMRVFLRGTDRYMLMVIADEDHIDDPAAIAFWDSFDFVDTK